MMKNVKSGLAILLLVATASNAGAESSACALRRFNDEWKASLVPLVREAVRFPTTEGNEQAMNDQKIWSIENARRLGFEARDEGSMVEIDLPGPEGAPVLGLVVHGDVVDVDGEAWAFDPFEATVVDGVILGRGVADDKGPLVQALLAMKSLADCETRLTHTIRLLIGTNEESKSTDVTAYLETHDAPAYSLVLDSEFPVVVGEKAWNMLAVSAANVSRSVAEAPFEIESLNAGIATSIVPDRAELILRWKGNEADWALLEKKIESKKLLEGTRLEIVERENRLTIRVHGKSAHAGVNLEGGRNALVSLARIVDGLLPSCGAADLLAFAKLAGADLHGTGLEIMDDNPLWGRYDVNVATISEDENGRLTMRINVRRIPPRTGPELEAHLTHVVEEFNERTGASLGIAGYWEDEPLVFDPRAKLVRRLLTVYSAATGHDAGPAISGGGTYAKRLPNAIAFGMWFPDRPYPGHDVDEKVSIESLERGTRVLIEALIDIATGPPIVDPFTP